MCEGHDEQQELEVKFTETAALARRALEERMQNAVRTALLAEQKSIDQCCTTHEEAHNFGENTSFYNPFSAQRGIQYGTVDRDTWKEHHAPYGQRTQFGISYANTHPFRDSTYIDVKEPPIAHKHFAPLALN